MAKKKKHRREISVWSLMARLAKLQLRAEASHDEPAPKEKRDRVLLTYLAALDTIASGKHPGNEEWRQLSDAVNTVETLVLRGNLAAREIEPALNAAGAAMAHAAERYSAGAGMRMDGAGLRALREIIEIYRVAMDGLPELEIALAQVETQERIVAIASGRIPTDRHVVAI